MFQLVSMATALNQVPCASGRMPSFSPETRDSVTVGLLSQSYLQAVKAQQIMVPICTFRRDGQNLYPLNNFSAAA